MADVPPRSDTHPALRRLGDRVRELRAARNWTQEDLAGETGLDRSYISGLEVGRRNPTYGQPHWFVQFQAEREPARRC